ncbi:MAG: N-acetylneuraminate synthase family protein [Desulfovibrionaceae bacterium]|nr:N-acetylneuraminate synthase family protein [Desulfovibrionaceae bacterium]
MSRPLLYLGDIPVGIGYPPVVVAELGINHNGSLAEAKKIVDSAHAVGCSIIKHQTHIVEDEMSSHAKTVVPSNSTFSIYEIMERCALSEEEEYELKCYIESKGMFFLSTPFSRRAVDRLEQFGVQAYKIGSGELSNHPLLHYIASCGKPIILSTGMNDIIGVKKAVSIIEQYNIPYALMHCTNIYPTPPEDVRLGAMLELQREFPNAVIGLSDHTVNNTACLAAIALGACIVERHYTDTKERYGEDIVCSMDQQELQELLNGASQIFSMLHSKKQHKGIVAGEIPTRDFAFATVVAIQDIYPGEAFTKDNIWVKRPGNIGIPAEEWHTLLGKKSLVFIPKDTHILTTMVE